MKLEENCMANKLLEHQKILASIEAELGVRQSPNNEGSKHFADISATSLRISVVLYSNLYRIIRETRLA